MRYFLAAVVFLGICIFGCGSGTVEGLDTNGSNSSAADGNITPVHYESNNSLYNTRNLTPLDIGMQSTTPVNNRGAYVTSQCYTKTVDENAKVHNPCFTCHINSQEPNYVNDWLLQERYAFGEYTRVNRFTNLFKDRTALVAQISDEEIVSYARENNYLQKGQILLANRLKNLPPEWDTNGDGRWSGYIPDCYFDFDNQGFDKTPEGDYTGWRAFGYYPFPGTFWPTNGSADDALIRLAEVFMRNAEGRFDIGVYKLNLSIVEALIKQKDIAIDEVDETLYGVDLNQNGVLDTANEIVFRWVKPSYDSATGLVGGFSMSYVGYAKELLAANAYLIAPGLYPKETEFLHSVRYIDADENSQSFAMAPRMKELRYARKLAWVTYSQLSNATLTDIKEKDAFPNRLRTVVGNTESGLLNDLGWVYQGFIEDARGELRPQNYEETLYCIGCHSGIGAVADSSFVFQRKFDSTHFQKGWYHWTQDGNGLVNVREPMTPDGKGEYSLYLEVNHAGDEFRDNSEVMARFFDANGSLLESERRKMSDDISHLLYPSVSRAKALNKAYKIIVEEQSFIYGREAHIKPVANVHAEVEIDTPTGVKAVTY